MFTPRKSLFAFLLLLCSQSGLLVAQDGAPMQPEFLSAPVPDGPRVNEFTGDFTYGIPILTVPGPHGSSYSMTLSYRAGTSPQAEVPWVGYGWSLNAGAVTRQKYGFPDDWQGTVTYHNQTPLNYTVSATYSATAEFGSSDQKDSSLLSKLNISVGANAGQRYDNLTGFAKFWGVSGGASFLGNYAGLNYMNDVGAGEQPSLIISPNLWMTGAALFGYDGKTKENVKENFWENTRTRGLNRLLRQGNTRSLVSREFNMSSPNVVGMHGNSTNYGMKFGINISAGVFQGGDIGVSGNVLEVWSIPSKPTNAYGFMQSAQAWADPSGVMDYYYENDVSFSLEDKFLPVPFSNADLFAETGGNTFRAFNRGLSAFRQNTVSSKIDVDNVEVKFTIGAGWGIGARWGDGSTEYAAGPWDLSLFPDVQFPKNDGDEPWFFRSAGDVGGWLLYDSDDKAVRANVVDGDLPALAGDVRLQHEEWERPGRNNYIGFTRNSDMELVANGKPYKSYTRDAATRAWVSDRTEMPEGIGEFAFTGEGGSRVVYGLPVYARDEQSLSLGLANLTLDSSANVLNNTFAYKWVDKYSASSVIGQTMSDPYATMWLITESTTPDYVDLTADGPTDDDLGGWTKFSYTRVAGSPEKASGEALGWTHWRSPYTGLAFNAGSLSDPKDDVGSFTSGKRETYYLAKVETKTHVAVFHLNDYWENTRADGYTHLNGFREPQIAGSPSVTSAEYLPDDTPFPNGSRRYLDRIELYVKGQGDAPDSLLSTVRFEYDYSLRPNMPNSLPVDPDSTTRNGLLTLRRVWVERQGVKNATISPYMFGYEYRTSQDYSAEARARYPEITSFADSLTSAMQNPPYTPYDVDVWGNHRPGGAERLQDRFGFVPQNDTSLWDPAAWQLKWIRQPSGGEVQIQYEEDEYAWVHDRPAMGMVSLYEEVGEGFGEQSDDKSNINKYFLCLTDIGVDSTDYGAVARVRDLLNDYDRRQSRLFFRFLYALKGDSAQLHDPEYQSEYIEGYADIDEIDIQTVNSGDPDEWYALYVSLIGRDSNGNVQDGGVPKQVCQEYVRTRKRGKLGPGDGIPYRSGTFRAVEMIWDLMGLPAPGFDKNAHCKSIDYAHSYVCIPLLRAKKGGGLRVKRLLSFDPGIEGDTVLLGTEYRYEQYDPVRDEVLSSGVAANEPAGIRAENPLVDFMPDELSRKMKGKVVAFSEIPKNEGPVGETLLPAASVGYARVASHPIHQGITASGFRVVDFHTYREYPFDGRYDGTGNAIDYTDIKDETYRTPFPLENFIVFQRSETEVRATQGYRFVLYDMHGRVKEQFSNGGRYTPWERDWMTTSSVNYSYFEPGDSIPLLYALGDTLRYGNPGKEMEVVHAARSNGAYIKDLKIEGDAGFWFLSGAGYYSVNNSELYTHVTNKISRYPAVVKGMLTFADGSYDYVENVALDPASGLVMVRASSDGHDGLKLDQSPSGHSGAYHAYTVPRAERYPELSAVSDNERAWIDTLGGFAVMKGIDSLGPFLDFPGGSETRWLRKLTSGDFLELTLVSPMSPEEADAGRYHVDILRGNLVYLIPSGIFNADADSTALDRTGQVFVEVVRSGRANSAGLALGGLSTYGQTAADVRDGVNVYWTGTGAGSRLALVDTLNILLGAGSGTLTTANVDTSLAFRHHTSGSCGTLGDLGLSFTLSTSGDTVFIAMSGYADTLLSQGRGGYFDLEESGQIVYRSVGNLQAINRPRTNPLAQRPLAVTFCDSLPALKTVAGTISAFAGTLNDTVDWDGSGVSSVPGEPNAYEKGERGRWSVRTGYAFHSSIVGSNDAVAGERIYKNGGVYEDFSLFNWADPGQNDPDRWERNDSITFLNRHNTPMGSVNRLGLHGLTILDYGVDRDHLPVLSVNNAEQYTAGFESFEVYDDTAFSGRVKTLVAHGGGKSLQLPVGDTSAYTMDVIVNDHLLEKGLLVQLWSTASESTDFRGRYVPATPADVMPENIVRTGQWTLYELSLHPDSLTLHFSPGDTLSLALYNAGASIYYFDDVKFLPTDALSGASATVYDPATYRPLAVFDDRHLGTYMVYNAQGRMYATVMETESGVRTMGDVHGHVAGVRRNWQGTGTPYYSAWGSGSLPNTSLGLPAGSNTVDFEVSRIQLGLDRQDVRLFGLRPADLRAMFDGEDTLSLSDAERYDALFDRYEELYKRREQLLNEQDADEEHNRQIREELLRIEEETESILENLQK